MKDKTQRKLIGMLFYLITIIGVLIYSHKQDQYNLEKHITTMNEIKRLSFQMGGLTYRDALLDHLRLYDSVSVNKIDSLYQIYLEKGGEDASN